MRHDDRIHGLIETHEPCWQYQYVDDKKKKVHRSVNVRTELNFISITAICEYLEIGNRLAMSWTRKAVRQKLARRPFPYVVKRKKRS